jgi:hypothetical protein
LAFYLTPLQRAQRESEREQRSKERRRRRKKRRNSKDLALPTPDLQSSFIMTLSISLFVYLDRSMTCE